MMAISNAFCAFVMPLQAKRTIQRRPLRAINGIGFARLHLINAPNIPDDIVGPTFPA
ncbi:hypothetical protein CT19425_U470011 [Cupriavidus taiwanensis]|uniref:Uncharacterized protein n=1 Tax=Cupriavidus taiwanensis TaxID=164546 RepID=A0A375IA91_9BURK|nr:hypothetical protein CT19425_U470011 [Cupriavidus taiwanensis]